MDKCKYRGGNVLCNEMLPQTLSCRDLFVAAKCDQMPFSVPCLMYLNWLFRDDFRRNELTPELNVSHLGYRL